MIMRVYCGRSGCGKLIGARNFSPEGRLLEEEYEPNLITYHGDEKDTWDGVMFCSQECCDKREKFVSPEEYVEEYVDE